MLVKVLKVKGSTAREGPVDARGVHPCRAVWAMFATNSVGSGRVTRIDHEDDKGGLRRAD